MEGEKSCDEKNDGEDAVLIDFGFKTNEHAETLFALVEPPMGAGSGGGGGGGGAQGAPRNGIPALAGH